MIAPSDSACAPEQATVANATIVGRASRMRRVYQIAALAFALAPLAQAQELDAAGRALLDAIRNEALHPADLVKRLKLHPDMIVADIGAGPGFFTLQLARAVPRGKVIASDVRADYLEIVLARARAAGLSNVTTEVWPASGPRLAPRSIDAAFLCQVDHYLPDRVSYFAQLRDALRPRGRVVVVNYVRHRVPDLEAAKRAGLRVIDEWAPSPPFFVLVLDRASLK